MRARRGAGTLLPMPLPRLLPVALGVLALGAAPASALAAEGHLDPTFGTGGTAAITPTADWSTGTGVLALPGGKVLAVGTSENESRRLTTLAQLNADGTPDTAFGDHGIVLDRVAGGSTGEAVARDAAGGLIVVGAAPGHPETTMPRWFMARYRADGDLDTDFADAGHRLDGFGPYADASGISAGARAVAIAPDGKIVVAGYAYWNDGPYRGANARHVVVARYTADGQPDHSFGPDDQGWVDIRPAGGEAVPDDVIVDADGTIHVAGGARFWGGGTSTDVLTLGAQSGPAGFVARVTADGALDADFGADGFALSDMSSDDVAPTDRAEAYGLARDADGRIVIAGEGLHRDGAAMTVARFTADGELDTSFGDDGEVVRPLGFGDAAYGDVTIDGDRIVVVGGGDTEGGSWIVASRFTEDGTPDPTFGDHGTTDSEIGSSSLLTGVALAEDGKVVAAGSSNGQMVTARYTGAAPHEQPGGGEQPGGDDTPDHGGQGTPKPPTTPTTTAPPAVTPLPVTSSTAKPGPVKGAGRRCVSRRFVTFNLSTAGLRSGRLVVKRGGRTVKAPVRRRDGKLRLDLRGLPKTTVKVTIVGKDRRSGKTKRVTRTFRTCVPRGRG